MASPLLSRHAEPVITTFSWKDGLLVFAVGFIGATLLAARSSSLLDANTAPPLPNHHRLFVSDSESTPSGKKNLLGDDAHDALQTQQQNHKTIPIDFSRLAHVNDDKHEQLSHLFDSLISHTMTTTATKALTTMTKQTSTIASETANATPTTASRMPKSSSSSSSSSAICSTTVPENATEIVPGFGFYLIPPYVCMGGKLMILFSLANEVSDSQLAALNQESELSHTFAVVLTSNGPSLNLDSLKAVGELQYLYSEKSAYGTLPAELFALTSLATVDIRRSNYVVGTIPHTLLDASHLVYLQMSDCNFTGSIPEGNTHLQQLQKLDLSASNIRGSIPAAFFASLESVQLVNMNWNQFEGSIPTEIGMMTKMSSLQLYRSYLSGTLPSQIGKLSLLEIMDLGENQLSGSIPSELGRLTLLRTITIEGNQFSGTLPTELYQLERLRKLNLASNQLEGDIHLNLEAIAQCDWSGLNSAYCARVCPPCLLSEFEVQPCDDMGHNQQCVPGYYFLPLLLVFFLAVAFALKRISPSGTPPSWFALEALMSVLSLADFATDVAFTLTIATNNTGTSTSFDTLVYQRVRLAAVLVLIFYVVVCFVVSVLVVSVSVVAAEKRSSSIRDYRLRAQTTASSFDTVAPPEYLVPPSTKMSSLFWKLLPASPKFAQRVQENTFLLSFVVTFCAINIRMIPFVVQGGDVDQEDQDILTSLSASSVSFQKASSFSVPSQEVEPTRRFEQQQRLVSLRTVVGLLTVILEDIPFISLHVVVLLLGGTRHLTVVSALVVSVISLIVECARIAFAFVS